MGHENINALWDEVPLIKQGLSPGQVKTPAIKPRRPVGREREKHIHKHHTCIRPRGGTETYTRRLK